MANRWPSPNDLSRDAPLGRALRIFDQGWRKSGLLNAAGLTGGMQIMRATERPQFEPLFPVRSALGLREEAIAPEVIVALEKLAGSITLLAETLSHNMHPRGGSQKPAAADG